MIKHSIEGVLFCDHGRELRIVAHDVSRTSAQVHAEGLGLLPIRFYITFDNFLTVGNADCFGGIGTILVSFSKDGLISASVSRLTKQELAIAVVTGTDNCSTLACRPSCRDHETRPRY
jgi:hypothetical protein